MAEVVAPAGEVVLVAAVGVAGRVGVVLEQVDDAADALFPQALLGARPGAARGCAPRPCRGRRGRRSSRTRGWRTRGGSRRRGRGGRRWPGTRCELRPQRHDPAEQVAGDLVGAQPALAAERAGDPVLVLEAEDAPLHRASPYPASRRSDGQRPALPFERWTGRPHGPRWSTMTADDAFERQGRRRPARAPRASSGSCGATSTAPTRSGRSTSSCAEDDLDRGPGRAGRRPRRSTPTDDEQRRARRAWRRSRSPPSQPPHRARRPPRCSVCSALVGGRAGPASLVIA